MADHYISRFRNTLYIIKDSPQYPSLTNLSDYYFSQVKINLPYKPIKQTSTIVSVKGFNVTISAELYYEPLTRKLTLSIKFTSPHPTTLKLTKVTLLDNYIYPLNLTLEKDKDYTFTLLTLNELQHDKFVSNPIQLIIIEGKISTPTLTRKIELGFNLISSLLFKENINILFNPNRKDTTISSLSNTYQIIYFGSRHENIHIEPEFEIRNQTQLSAINITFTPQYLRGTTDKVTINYNHTKNLDSIIALNSVTYLS